LASSPHLSKKGPHNDHHRSPTEVTRSHFETLTHPAWREFFAKYRVKVVETWQGGEGCGMNAELYRKDSKKKLADIRDDGNGGCCYYFVHYSPHGAVQRVLGRRGKAPPV